MAARSGAWALVSGLPALLLAGCGPGLGWGEGGPSSGAAATTLPRSTLESPEPAVELVGLDRDAVQGLLGPPRRVRRDSPAEVWQYLTEACVVDLFLYHEGGGYKVTFYEARNFAGDDTQPAPCLSALRSRTKISG